MFSHTLVNCQFSNPQVTCILFMLLIQLNNVGQTLGQNYHVTYDKSGAEIDRSPLDVYCYQFTWVGPIEEDYNKTKSCKQVERKFQAFSRSATRSDLKFPPLCYTMLVTWASWN